jgi:hypothetical protein
MWGAPYGKFEKRPLLAAAIKTSEDVPLAQLDASLD